jgi:exosortase/archaeosortase family protein
LNRESWAYLIRFGLGLALLFGVSRWERFIEAVREPYCEALAFTLHHVFAWVGIETRLNGSMLIPKGSGGGIRVVTECDGLVLLALFGAGVLAVPFARSARPWLLALAGVVFLIVLNWFRLAGLAITSFYYPVIFDSMHHYFMQGILMLAVLALYVAWLRQLEPPGPLEAAPEEASPAT